MKHKELLKKMTLEEKAAILSGASEWESREIKRLGIPSIFFSDGPHGVRKQEGEGDHLGLNASVPSTCFPTAATIANSWDEKLGEEIGEALGEEAGELGVDVLLGPGLNIKRSPLCGRNFEYFSEDPHLSGKMAAAYVKGIQKKGVVACPKHFAVNSQELRRMAMNSVVDERTLREIYLEGFEIALKEGKAGAIMTSYNQVNGEYANENSHLLIDILRKEWKFEGMVVTDWGGSNDHVKGVACRSNIEMPNPGLDSARQIIDAVKDKKLSTEALDQCVDDLLDGILKLESRRKDRAKKFDRKEHHKLAQKAARESIVMLKNDGEVMPVLPLKEKSRVVLIGDFAAVPRYQGAGSSMVNPTSLETMEEVIRRYPLNYGGYAAGYSRNGKSSEGMKKEAIALAQTADVVLYCFGLDELSESEGIDRVHMKIPQNQIELLEELAKANANIVGIISAGSAIEMPWEKYCKAILHGYLGGQAAASAMMDILTGKENPSGKLSETYPICYEDTPAYENFPSKERTAYYKEGIFVGYRYYDTANVKVRYPFGYGLSYTTFEYSNLTVEGNKAVFKITNTGEKDGAEIVQMYVSGPDCKIFRPLKELKGFKKVFLKAKESKRVEIPFDEKTFRYWNVKTNQWEIQPGEYMIQIGASVSDIRLKAQTAVEGKEAPLPYDSEKMTGYFSGRIQKISNGEFEVLLGKEIPVQRWSGLLGRNDAICQMYYAKSILARGAYRLLTHLKKKSEEKGKPDLNILFIYNMPFRGIAKMTHGAVSMEMADGMVEVVNGHLVKGLKMMIGGFFRNKKQNKQYEEKLKFSEKK